MEGPQASFRPAALYSLSEDRLFCETGFLNIKADEVLLYRVRDLELTISLGQRIFGVGTVCVHSSDQSIPHLDLKNVKHPREVKELIHQKVEKAKNDRRMKSMEVMSNTGSVSHEGDFDDMDHFDDDTLD